MLNVLAKVAIFCRQVSHQCPTGGGRECIGLNDLMNIFKSKAL